MPIETDSDFVITKSLLYDVTGKVRKDQVRLPTSILSDKPGAVPNQKVCTEKGILLEDMAWQESLVNFTAVLCVTFRLNRCSESGRTGLQW